MPKSRNQEIQKTRSYESDLVQIDNSNSTDYLRVED